MTPDPASLDAARMAVVDLITAAAAAEPPSLHAPLGSAFGAGPASVWFSGMSLAPAAAGFANSFAAAFLDLDDGHRAARGHPGAAVIPAVLAEADRLEALGAPPADDAIAHAIVVGYEIGIRIGAARGFYARTGYWGSYGAAAGVAALRDLPPDVVANALAIAGETSPHMLTTTAGPAWPQPDGTHVKEGIPWSVANGTVGAELAAAGFHGPLDMLDHPPFFDPAAILRERPSRAIHETYTKFHCCCRHLHAPIDALLAIMGEHGLGANEIDSIDVHAYSGALRIANRTDPETIFDVQYSIPYCLGLVAYRGREALLPLSEASLHDGPAVALAKRVRLSIDDAFERRFPAETLVRVVVHSRGRRYESAVTAPRGEAGETLAWQDRLDKFHRATRLSLMDDGRVELAEAFERVASGEFAPLRALLATNFPRRRP